MDHSTIVEAIIRGWPSVLEKRIPRGFEKALELGCLGGRQRHPIRLVRGRDLSNIVCPDCQRVMATGKDRDLVDFWNWLHQVKHEV